MRRKRLLWNTVFSIVQQVIAIIYGFVLPRYILQYYGTNVNGLVSSITQFLGFISFMQLGVGAVIQSALYKPLADEDHIEISKIFISAERFFKKIAFLFLVYILVLCLVYPYLVEDSFDYLFTDSLIIIIAISLFTQYYLGLANQLLLFADQRAYVSLFIQTLLTVINTLSSVLLMYAGASVQIVKLCTSLLYTLNPIIMMLYVKKHYSINKHITLLGEPIKQKWNGFAQHLSSVVMDNTDVMILTIFARLSDVSIYYVYHMVVYGMRQLISSLTVGIQSVFGNMIALNEREKLHQTFSKVEILFHFGITFVYICVVILIVPFVLVYTKGVNDADYKAPVFAIFISLAYASYCYGLPYYAIIKAAGCYKQTQNSAFIQVLINIVFSIIMVLRFGLVGVAIGTLAATIYRTLYFVYYLSKHIMHRKMHYFIKNILIDMLCFLASYLLTRQMSTAEYTYQGWFILAIKVASICFMVCVFFEGVGNRETIHKMFYERRK